MPASTDFANKILDHALGGGDYTRLANVYVALYTADPGVAGDAEDDEVTGTGYARVAMVNNPTNWPAASSRVKENGTEIDFGTAGSGGWGVVTHFGIVSTASGTGLILFVGALTPPKTIDADDPVKFGVGDLTINVPAA